MVRHVIFLLMTVLAVVAVEANPTAVVRHRQGDDMRWAGREWDDHDWAAGGNIPVRQGIYWVRFHVTPSSGQPRFLSDSPAAAPTGLKYGGQIDSVFLAAPYSYEIYWDGHFIGRSGVVAATQAEERTGPLDNVWPVPRELLAPGEHVVAIRLSSFHYSFPAQRIDVGFLFTNNAGHFREEFQHAVFPLVGIGGSLLVAVICGVLFGLIDRWRPLLLCSLLSFAMAVFYLLIAWRWLHNDNYEWFYPRLIAITCVMTLISSLFPWLLLEQFKAPRRLWWLAVLAGLLGLAWISSPIYEIKALWMGRAMLVVSVGVAGWGVWRRRPGAWFLLAGALAGLLTVQADRRDFLNPAFFVIFSLLALSTFALLGVQLRADRRRTQASQLAAVRLDLELLKKNIQPHFMLNTLMTIIEVIEREPKLAVGLIEGLAHEFRIFTRVSGERLIPLGQELELCRTHLKIMSLRKLARCSLQVADGLDERQPVPPALFHTLIENGLTHLQPVNGELRFDLDGTSDENGVRYTFTAFGKGSECDRLSATLAPREGTGLRYVKARLEESFPGRWSLHGWAVPEGWRTVIEIRSGA